VAIGLSKQIRRDRTFELLPGSLEARGKRVVQDSPAAVEDGHHTSSDVRRTVHRRAACENGVAFVQFRSHRVFASRIDAQFDRSIRQFRLELVYETMEESRVVERVEPTLRFFVKLGQNASLFHQQRTRLLEPRQTQRTSRGLVQTSMLARKQFLAVRRHLALRVGEQALALLIGLRLELADLPVYFVLECCE
jgi:hypothetical protein